MKTVLSYIMAIAVIVTATGFGPNAAMSMRAAKVQAMSIGAQQLHLSKVKANVIERTFSNNGKECTITVDVTPAI